MRQFTDQILSYATTLKELIAAYHSSEAITLSQSLDRIIKSLRNSTDCYQANFDLLVFMVYLVHGSQFSLAGRRIRLTVRNYYYETIRAKIVNELSHVKELALNYKDYQNKIFSLLKNLNKQLMNVDKSIEKNSTIIIELSHSLNVAYPKLLTEITCITGDEIDQFERINEGVKSVGIKVLRHNKKVFDLKNHIKKQLSLIRKENDFCQDIVIFNSLSLESHDSMDEVSALEWLIRNQYISINSEQPQQEKNEEIKPFMSKVKKNFIKFFLLTNIDSRYECLKRQFEQLEKESEEAHNVIKIVENEQLDLTKELALLKDSIKEKSLFAACIEGDTKLRDISGNTSTKLFAGRFQFFPYETDSIENKTLLQNVNINAQRLNKVSNVNSEQDFEDMCFIM